MEDLNKKMARYRISKDEYAMICERLGRPPQGLEWALFSALWSEHCSYKSSKVHLKKLFNQSPRVMQSFGENAGVIDLGFGERVAFKMESHNHPSFIEPYQGAATGVGGILRDIFTMGARPIALANYLCFGEPSAPRMQALVDGVVRGISGYGNCVGVPNITGQTEFHSSYNQNILVNAFALGYFGAQDKIFLSKASGPGNAIVYVGAKTGRDGVHGASMASESFDNNSEAKKPNVQIGDPFFEKCLIESCLEVMKRELVVAIQDMGAAGLTSSSFEMASKGQVGFSIHLDQVPVRDAGISPEEIMLSESQERMLLVCEPAKVEELQKVFHRWGLDATVIGEVKKERVVELFWRGEQIVKMDPDLLVENAPQYQRPYQQWDKSPENKIKQIVGTSEQEQIKTALNSVQGTSREWIYRQYDQRVGGATQFDCSETIGVVRLPETQRLLGIVLGCRPYIMRHDAYVGGIDSVAYPALELAAKGFEPLAVTDCLNFGNPEKLPIMSEFVAALAGMNEMCAALRAPIISGNVSFYNETLGNNITSTPATGVVGLREDSDSALPASHFAGHGDIVYLLRLPRFKIGSDEPLRPQEIAECAVEFSRIVREITPASTRVVGKFGLGYALARMTLPGVGAKIRWEGDLAEETLYEVIVVVAPKKREVFTKAIAGLAKKCEVFELGETGGDSLNFVSRFSTPVAELKKSYHSGWRNAFANLA